MDRKMEDKLTQDLKASLEIILDTMKQQLDPQQQKELAEVHDVLQDHLELINRKRMMME